MEVNASFIFSRFNPFTFTKLLKIDDANNKEVLFSNEEWPYLYPSSLTLNENVLYIGMRGRIGNFNLESRIMKWMKIKAPFSNFTKSNFYQPKKLINQRIKSMGLVAGFEDFSADICLAEIGLY